MATAFFGNKHTTAERELLKQWTTARSHVKYKYSILQTIDNPFRDRNRYTYFILQKIPYNINNNNKG